MALTSPIGTVGEAAQEKGKMESLIWVGYGEDNLKRICIEV